MDWTEEAEAELRRLWAQPLSTAEIGRRMGCTKNMIVGKARRMGLPGRQSPIQRDLSSPEGAARRQALRAEAARLKGQGRTDEEVGRQMGLGRFTAGRLVREAGAGARGGSRKPLAVGAGVPPLPAESTAPEPLARPVAAPILRLSGECRWPIGDPGTPGFRFCAKPAPVGKPYCAACSQKADVRPVVSGVAMAPRGWVA